MPKNEFPPNYWKDIGEAVRDDARGKDKARDREQIWRNDSVDVGEKNPDGTYKHDAAYKANKALAVDIRAALHKHKRNRFVIAWRIFPNSTDDSWHNHNGTFSEDAVCGCGCGCGE